MYSVSFTWRFVALSAAAILTLVLPISGQPTCTPSMLTGFTPCMTYINGIVRSRTLTGPPPPDCCTSVKTLAANGSECYCQLVTGRSPFQFQVNQTLAQWLARGCNTPRISLQCEAATSAPIPAPGPGAFAPLLAPTDADTPPPVLSPSESDTPSVTSSTPPATAAGSSPAKSASSLLAVTSPHAQLLIAMGALVLMYN